MWGVREFPIAALDVGPRVGRECLRLNVPSKGEMTAPRVPTRVQRLMEGRDRRQTGPATAWASGAAICRQAIVFIGLLVLARVLSPADFGLYAIIMAVTNFGLLFTELGLGAAIVTGRDVAIERLSSAFWLNLSSAAGLGLASALLAYPIAAIYGEARLAVLLCVTSLTFIFSIATVQLALLERSLDFRRVFLVETLAAVVGQGTAIVSALLGAGALSLALIGPSTALTTAMLAWAVAPWKPLARIERSEVRDIWSFSRHLVAFNAINYWSRNLDNLLLPLVATPASVGFYTRAYSLMMLPLQQVSTVASRVMLPVMVANGAEGRQLGPSWVAGARLSWILGLPIATTLVIAAPDTVSLLLGDQWAGAASLVSILAIAIPPQLITRTSGAGYQVLSRTDVQFKLGLICTAFTALCICLGLPWGSRGVAVGVSVSYFGHLAMVTWDLPVRLGLSRSGFLRGLYFPLFASVVAAGCGWTVSQGLTETGVLLRLSATVTSVFLCYFGLLVIQDRSTLHLVRSRGAR